MHTKFRPGMPRPSDARTLKTESGSSLFLDVQSHASITGEAAAKLDAYAKGTPKALEKFYAAREMIAREEEMGGEGGGGGAGPPGVVGQGGGAGALHGGLGEVSRDPRLRR